MNTWVISPNVKNNEELNNWIKVTSGTKRVFMGYDNENEGGAVFAHKIKKGDIILIAQGANRQKKVYACGIVHSEAIYEYLVGTPSIAQNRTLRYFLGTDDLLGVSNLFNENCAYGASNQIPAIYLLKESTPADKVIIDELKARVEKHQKHQKQKHQMQHYINLLKQKILSMFLSLSNIFGIKRV